MLVGGIGLVDLRAAGAFRALPLAELTRYLTPIALAGLAISAATGAILFAADAAALVASDTFWRKLVLIALALANALAFRLLWRRRRARGTDETPPLGRAMAVLSLALWLAVATQGRMIAYS